MRRRLFVATSVLALGCGAPYAKVDGILVDTQPVPVAPAVPAPPPAAAQPARVTLTRKGKPRPAAVKQSIVGGDRVVTAARSSAVLTLKPGYEMLVEPGTDVRIEDQTIVVRIGRVLLKKLKKTKQRLEVRSEFVSAGVEGTQFVFEVLPDERVHIATIDGAVTVNPREAAWQPVTYRAGEEGFIRRGAAPDRIRSIDRAATQLILDRTATVERAVQYRAGEPWSRFKPLWKKPQFFVPAAAATAAAVIIAVSSKGEPAVRTPGNIP